MSRRWAIALVFAARAEAQSARLIHVPVAADAMRGALDLRFDTARDFARFPADFHARNAHFALSFLPRLTLGGRGTTIEQLRGARVATDLSANVQFLALRESRFAPAVAIGATDVGGAASLFRSRYVTASKSLTRFVRATVGFGVGPDLLDGGFGGIEISPARFATVVAEYDADAFAAGVRLAPIPARLERYGAPRVTIGADLQEGGHLALDVGVATVLGEDKYAAQRERRAQTRFVRRAPPSESGGETASRIANELARFGFENVRTEITGQTISIDYENRRYNRDELEALGIVLGVAAMHTPATITRARVVVRAVDVPVFEIATDIAAFVAFVNEQSTDAAFGAQLAMTNDPSLAAASRAVNRSRFKLDLFLRPRIETMLLTDWSVFEARFSLLPDADVQLARGLVLNARAAIPIARTSGYLGRLADPSIDRVLLMQTLRLPGPASQAGAITQFSAGRFDTSHVGVSNETAVTLRDGRFFLKGTVARLHQSSRDEDGWVALANARVRHSAWAATLSVTAGRFLDGDDGVATDVSRFFGTTEVGAFLRRSNRASLAGVRITLPLTVPRELRPARVRPRLPDVYAYEQRTQVFADENLLRNDVGRGLASEHEIERVYWRRDRLYASFVRRHVDVLRHAVRTWIDGAS